MRPYLSGLSLTPLQGYFAAGGTDVDTGGELSTIA
jgi:hypothetical protein